MKLLLDEHLPYALARELPGHDVFSTRFMSWASVGNGQLLALAAAEGFDALLTLDRAMPLQQNPATLPVPIVVLHAKSGRLEDLVPLVDNLLAALGSLLPRAIAHVYP